MKSAERPQRANLLEWVAWLGIASVATSLMVAFGPRLEPVHIALVYLLIVLGASAQSGRALGLSLALLTFLSFNFFFLPPYHTFTIARPLDWIVLLSYLVTATVAAQLLSRAEREAAESLRLAAEAEHAQALREAARMKDALLAAVSHDLRTPLTTIRALAEDMASEGDERAMVIAEEGERLTHFVSDLLDFSGIHGGGIAVRPEVNAVEDLLGAAIQQVSGALGERELRATIDTSQAILLARFDFVHTLRILVNLLSNAHKYSPPGQPIELSAARDGWRVLITVADRGPGVPESEREKIFQPFYRGPGITPDVTGTGLGLPIAAALAQAQDADLSYHPRAGGGSEFVLSLPYAEVFVRP